MGNEILRMQHITKVYPNGVVANYDVSFDVREGEIHALMGENGAGKSTLMNILFGALHADAGEIYYRNQLVTDDSSAQLIQKGIGMVHQHFMLVESFSVYENVLLGIEPKKHFSIDRKVAIQMVHEIADQYQLKVEPNIKVSDLSVGLKQKVEILKALIRGAKLIILDEPTAVLTPQETQELFEQLKLLKESGHTIIFISHKIKEVMQLCDRFTVLRGGKTMGTYEIDGMRAEDISRLMIGRDVSLHVDKTPANFGEDLLQVKNVRLKNEYGKSVLDDVSFSLRRGQILGIAGVEGNGQDELAACIFGLQNQATGSILLEGKELLHQKIVSIRRAGVAYIPEDRMQSGLCAPLNIWENIIATRSDQPNIQKNGLLQRKSIEVLCTKLVADFQIACQSLKQSVNRLSGGNMQKIVVARELADNPKLLIANQPTRGIDVGANEFIWKKLLSLREEGQAILLISADLSEIMALSDSILVMCNGEAVAYFEDASKVDEHMVGEYMLGIKKQEKQVGGEQIV